MNINELKKEIKESAFDIDNRKVIEVEKALQIIDDFAVIKKMIACDPTNNKYHFARNVLFQLRSNHSISNRVYLKWLDALDNEELKQ